MVKRVIKKFVKRSKLKRAIGSKSAKSKITNSTERTLSSMNSEELFSLIQKSAYDLYVKSEGDHGDDVTHWIEAEKKVLESLVRKNRS